MDVDDKVITGEKGKFLDNTEAVKEEKKEQKEVEEEVKFLRRNQDFLIVRAHVQRMCNKYGFRMRVDSVENLNKKVERLVKEACVRAKKNDRRTVHYRDF